MTVLRPEFLEEREGLEKRGNALHWPVRHVGDGLTLPAYRLDVGALRHQVQNELIVAPRGGVVERRVPVEVARVDVGMQFLDECFIMLRVVRTSTRSLVASPTPGRAQVVRHSFAAGSGLWEKMSAASMRNLECSGVLCVSWRSLLADGQQDLHL